MTDALIIITILAFLLIGSIVIIWKQRGELKRGQLAINELQRQEDQRRHQQQDHYIRLLDGLKLQLQQASKNDHRDARGRFSKAGEA